MHNIERRATAAQPNSNTAPLPCPDLQGSEGQRGQCICTRQDTTSDLSYDATKHHSATTIIIITPNLCRDSKYLPRPQTSSLSVSHRARGGLLFVMLYTRTTNAKEDQRTRLWHWHRSLGRFLSIHTSYIYIYIRHPKNLLRLFVFPQHTGYRRGHFFILSRPFIDIDGRGNDDSHHTIISILVIIIIIIKGSLLARHLFAERRTYIRTPSKICRLCDTSCIWHGV